MKESIILIKSFKSKQDLIAEPVAGRIFTAEITREGYQIKFGETVISLKEGLTDNGNFSCEAIVVTQDNYKSLKLHKDDRKLIDQLFREDKVKKAVDKAQKDFEKRMDKAFDTFGELAGNDPLLLISLAKMAEHMNKTFSDKYGEDSPDVDLTNLMRKSKNGKVWNTGNALKYCKRYLTEGFPKSYNPEDLLKAAHYIANELDRRENEA